MCIFAVLVGRPSVLVVSVFRAFFVAVRVAVSDAAELDRVAVSDAA